VDSGCYTLYISENEECALCCRVKKIVEKVKRYKPYYKNNGGVTFSGGEPLLQPEFIIETCKLLKKENIHIALDTAGVGLGDYDEILNYITQVDKLEEFINFVNQLNKTNIEVWIRQVIVPGLSDNEEYIYSLVTYLKKIKNIERIDFLPYHKLGQEKYQALNIEYPYENLTEMDKNNCQKLYKLFIEKYNKNSN